MVALCESFRAAFVRCVDANSSQVDLEDDFDATFVDHIRSADASAQDREKFRSERRLRIMGELLSTERSYVSALRLLERVYTTPLRLVADQPQGAIFSHNDLDKIFINVHRGTIELARPSAH
jgi:hypothetical protein